MSDTTTQMQATTQGDSDEAVEYGPYDEANPPPMDFETWAALSAALLKRDQEAQLDILDERDIDPDLFDACDGFWLSQLAAQVDRDNLGLAMRYGKICKAELDARPADEAAAGDAAGAHEVDQTAFMTALADETALPFKAPDLAAGAKPPPAAAAESPPPKDETGETQLLDEPPFPDGALPFDRKGDD